MCSNSIDLNSWPAYKYFANKPQQKPCKDLGIGVPTPSDWGTECPILYFPLDTTSLGSKQGPHPANIQFTSGGKVGNAFYNPVPDSATHAWHEVGSFMQPDYCFPDPISCPHGVSIAFWLKIIGAQSTGTGKQGIITTAKLNRPGFAMFWIDDSAIPFQGLTAAVGGSSRTEMVEVSKSTVLNTYPYNTWFHIVMTYRYGFNMHMY